MTWLLEALYGLACLLTGQVPDEGRRAEREARRARQKKQ